MGLTSSGILLESYVLIVIVTVLEYSRTVLGTALVGCGVVFADRKY